jgi:hypothetical protein
MTHLPAKIVSATLLLAAASGGVVAWWQLANRISWAMLMAKKHGDPYAASVSGAFYMVFGCGVVVATALAVATRWPRRSGFQLAGAFVASIAGAAWLTWLVLFATGGVVLSR